MSWDAALAVVGATLLLLGLSAGLIKNRWLASEPLVALSVGILVGLSLSGWHQLDAEGTQLRFLEEAARFTLTIALLDVAMRLPKTYFAEAWRPLLVMLGLVMPLMWVASTALAALLLGLSPALALLVGAVITPTDPVLAGSIVSGRLAESNLPAPLRRLITAESGANDTLALPLVAFALTVAGTGSAFPRWLIDVVVFQIGGGLAIGACAGWLTARCLRWAQAQPDAEQASLTSVGLAMAITVLGTVRLLDGDGVLAAFVAGAILNRFLPGELSEQRSLFHETARRFFELPVFILLGMMLPFADWIALGWPLWIFGAAVLLVRRTPAIFLVRSLVEPIADSRDALFAGWFGPIGIAALYYAAFAVRGTGETLVWTVTSFVVTVCIVAHGLSGTALAKRYGRRKRDPQAASSPDP